MAARFDLTTGPGRAALDRLYITPTVTALERIASRTFGSDRRPFKNKAYAATVAATVQSTPAGTVVIFKLGPTGFWVYGQYGTKPHQIPRNAPARGKQATKGLKGDGYGHPTRQPVQHPGAKGKHAIDQAWRAIRHDQHQTFTAIFDELVTNG